MLEELKIKEHELDLMACWYEGKWIEAQKPESDTGEAYAAYRKTVRNIHISTFKDVLIVDIERVETGFELSYTVMVTVTPDGQTHIFRDRVVTESYELTKAQGQDIIQKYLRYLSSQE